MLVTFAITLLLAGCRTDQIHQPRQPASGSLSMTEGPALLSQSIVFDGATHRYGVFVPAGYDSAKPWPFVLFLHGQGECGTDGFKQLTVGLPPAAVRAPDRWPFVILIPQKPESERQWEDYEPLLMAMIDKTRRDFTLDPHRLYLTGLSQGGHGTWVLASRRTIDWAAIAPICGYGDPASIAPGLNGLPIWAFHGEQDPVVPAAETRRIVAAITAQGRTTPRATYYPKTGHDAWDPAYADPSLPLWLLEHRTGPVRP